MLNSALMNLDTNRDRFQYWYAEPIEILLKNEHAGFAVMTLTLPILERYLRHKLNIPSAKLTPDFHAEIDRLIPEFKKVPTSEFWSNYRNGLLHQATVQGHYTFLKDDGPIVSYWNGRFGVSPTKFARRVLSIVSADIDTFFDADGDKPQIATVQETAGRSGVFRP